MAKWYIDYRNGGMGNTVLAHVLYSCGQINLDLAGFFHYSGNAHAIAKINQTDLIAHHGLEDPVSDVQCILQLVTWDWYEILRLKMSYSKWFMAWPDLSNWQDFYQLKSRAQSHEQWQEFYSVFKDPNWPECERYEDLASLPTHIQQEIHENYIIPTFTISTQRDLLEFLTASYFDQIAEPTMSYSDVPIYQLSQYFDRDFDQLQNLAERLCWTWSDESSDRFYLSMLEANRIYLDWLQRMKNHHDAILVGQFSDGPEHTWELALLLAKVCHTTNTHPNMIKWNNGSCDHDKNSINFHKLLKENFHGQPV